MSSTGLTEEIYRATLDRVIPDRSNPPAGLIAHFAGPRADGGRQVVGAWESEQAYQAFVEGTLSGAAQELGAPPFDTTVTPLHNSLIA